MSVVPRESNLPERREVPVGARALGPRVKPLLRLGLGYRDENKRGAPTKTDYFTVRGNERAVAKFAEAYGAKPKAVDILLPAELRDALTISYVAFKGSGGAEGGSLVAYSDTNFAALDYCGGPDVITVFTPDGDVDDHVEITGLDDPVAVELGLQLITSFRFGLPKVLGFGSFAAVSTKGKESTDNVWLKVRELYAIFGSRVTVAVAPQLVIRPSTVKARIVNKESGEVGWGKAKIFVLDLVVPETIEEMIGRLRERQEVLAPQGPVAALYGPPQGLRVLPAAEEFEVIDEADVEVIEGSDAEPAPPGSHNVGEESPPESASVSSAGGPGDASDVAGTDKDMAVPSPAGPQQAGPGPVPAKPGPSPAPGADDPGDEPALDEPALDPADILIPPFGDGKSPRVGRPLAEADGKFVGWALRKEAAQPTYFPPAFVTALEAYAQANHPNVWTAVKGAS